MALNKYIAHLLLRIAKNDDRKSFEALFKLFYEKLFRFSMNYVQSRPIAEEIVSDVFLKLWQNRKKLTEINNINTYLYVATKNQSINYLQKKTIDFRSGEDIDLSSFIDWFDPQRALEYQEMMHDLQLAVENLPDQCKIVFKLIREDGLKYKEAAEILGISVRTVETQLFRAIKKIGRALEPFLDRKKHANNKSR